MHLLSHELYSEEFGLVTKGWEDWEGFGGHVLMEQFMLDILAQVCRRFGGISFT